jgi:antitoxin component of MazEF toxin-antitoxin module
MDRTEIFRNGGSLAVRIPKKRALPAGDVMIDERDGTLMLPPPDDRDWPGDLDTRFAILADLEAPVWAKDSKSVEL